MKKKVLFITILAICLIVFFGYNYIYQDHRDISTEQAEFVLSTSKIAKEFSLNAIAAEKKYLDKTIQVDGTLTEINTNDITINDAIFCAFDIPITQTLFINSSIKIKGRVIGYDDLLEQIKIDQTIIIN